MLSRPQAFSSCGRRHSRIGRGVSIALLGSALSMVVPGQADAAEAQAAPSPGKPEASPKASAYAESRRISSDFPALADEWLQKREGANAPVAFPPSDRALPDFPSGCPEAFRKAVARYLQVTAPFEALRKSAKPTLGYNEHRADYAELLAEVVGPGESPFTEKVMAYRWGHWCGTGSDVFYVPQASAMAVALVRDKRWPEAAGALLDAGAAGRGVGASKLLSELVPDLEQVLIGGLALKTLERGWSGEQDLRKLLAQLLLQPGDGRVDALISLASQAKPGALPSYYEAVAKFVDKEPRPVEKWPRLISVRFGGGWVELPEVDLKGVSPEAQQRALDFLIAQATPALSIESANKLSKIFQEKGRPAAEPALRRLLEHPSEQVAETAVKALQEMGIAAEAPRKLGPVRYRILLNGSPLAAQKINWHVAYGEGGGGVGADGGTDGEGILEISRDYFLDPTKTVAGVALRSGAIEKADDLWFGVVQPPPPGNDDVITVDLAVKPLRVKLDLPRPEADFAGKSMAMTLSGEQTFGRKNVGYWSGANLSLPIAGEVEFKNVMPGDYFAQILVPGAAAWSGTLRVGATPEVSLPLQRGSDIRFTVRDVPPQVEGAMYPVLMQNGKRVDSNWDYARKILCGVPVGDYVLHLPSSEEVKKRIWGGLKDGAEFAGVDVPFSVREDSPVEIDLGEIRVK